MSVSLVDVRQVSKCYRLWANPADRLVAMLLEQAASIPVVPAGLRRRLDLAADRHGARFHALHETSFSLPRGESLGIIGRNGSGKSTLLQILAGTLQPTSGGVEISGRIAALLELGSGFNPEFTGRENVMLQAALLGLSRREIMARFNEVEDFAGIGAFIDQPAKVYSSGMLVRLAFAAQTILEPELFIVDEALAVGDVFFQAKCARFFEERLREGMSLILVSHDLVAVKALCRNALVLHDGRVAFAGPSAEAVNRYHELHRIRLSAAAESPAMPGSPQTVVTLPAGAVERNWNATQEVGSREVEIVHCVLLDTAGVTRSAFELGERVRLDIYVRSKLRLEGVVLGFELSDRHNRVVYGATSIHLKAGFKTVSPGRLHRYEFTFDVRLGSGEYLVDVAIGWGDRGDGAPEHLMHRVTRVGSLSVGHPGGRPAFFGAADLHGCFESE